MSTEEKTDTTLILDNQKLDEWNNKFFQIDRRMARKLQFETKKHDEKKGDGKTGSPKSQMEMPNIPSPYPGKKEFDSNISKIKALPVEERKPKYEVELQTLDNLGKKLLPDKTLNTEAKKPIAADIKTAKETIQAEMANDIDEIKNLKAARKKSITDQLNAMKVTMSRAEKVPGDNGELTKAIVAFQSAKAGLLKALTLDMTPEAAGAADTALKKLKSATENVLALKANRDQIAEAQKTVKTLGPQFMPDEKNSFPAGSTRAIDKATDRTIGGHGPLFKPVLKGLEEVEKSPVEKNLATLENAAKNYLADYDRRVKEGQDSNKPFKPDKITTKKAETCRDAIEKVRKLRVTRDIQDGLAKLPQNPTTPEEVAALNKLKAKMLVESGGSKKLGEGESGASESFFLTDPTTNEKAFIFKPSDGEFDAGYGWKKGGGAPREVVLSAVNEAFKSSIGLDCGVNTTTLVAVDSPNVATERNGNNSKRVGAVQNFVKSDRGLSNKLDQGKKGYDANYINQIPAEDIEKIAILDFATLQMDRQASNLLVQPDPNGAPRLTPIDAGNAMPSRKAFEASRRMFTSNAVLGGAEAKKPFSAEAQKQIDEIDEKAIVAAMKKANAEMAKVDPDAGTAVEDETIEMTRRSILFLKKAAKVLTKAEIADAYALLFHEVIDAKPNEVDRAIDEAIKAQQAKPGIVDAVDKFPNAQKVYENLGWPSSELMVMRTERPDRLLKILQDNQPCPATVKEISRIISEVGIKNFEKDPNTIVSYQERLSTVKTAKAKLDDKAILDDPELAKKAKKLGIEFVTVNKSGEKKPMADQTKAALARRINEYETGGGDDALKKRGKSPAKMTFEEKYFESLGGDELIAELDRKSLNPYTGPKIDLKIDDLKDYKLFESLGGEEAYVRLGCPQNKEVTLFSRTQMMKSKLMVE